MYKPEWRTEFQFIQNSQPEWATLNLYSNQEFHEDEELARAIALSLEIFNRPKSAGKIFKAQRAKKEEG